MMREHLGDGYAEALRSTYSDVPESADFVLYWWHKSAELVRNGKARRFGLITTNSLRQTFLRRIVQAQLGANPPLSLAFAIPDHPWVETDDGAAVRIAMTVGIAGEQVGELLEVTDEQPQDDGSEVVTLNSRNGKISADLTLGADVGSAVELNSNEGLANRGVCLFGSGFVVTPEKAKELGLGRIPALSSHIRQYRNGKDITDRVRGVMVIDLFGLSAEVVREKFPAVYQHVLTHVKPERDQNKREVRRLSWWIFGEPNKELRRMLVSLRRFIVTLATAKHRTFTFLSDEILPDDCLVTIALDDAFHLGVLSSKIHVIYALAAGGTLEDRPRYNKSRCFDPFPFPDCTEPQRDRIRKIAEELDAHRKRVQVQHDGLTLTGMYNVLEKLRANQPLNSKEKLIHDQGLVSVLKQLHDDLDTAVFEAYGWPRTLTDAEILERLVALNAERAREEAAGHIRWLRPDYQIPLFKPCSADSLSASSNPGGAKVPLSSHNLGRPTEPELPLPTPKGKKPKTKSQSTAPENSPLTTSHLKLPKLPWPKSLPDRMKAVLAEVEKRGATPFTPEDIARAFKRAQTPQVIEILETLCAVGKAKKQKNGTTYTA